MNIVPQRYELPLFMPSRNILRKNRIEELKAYIAKQGQLYLEQCKKDNVTMTASHKQLRHLVGLDPANVNKCHLQPMQASGRIPPTNKVNSWQLPSNLYDTIKVPYASKKGSSGAYWPKMKLKKMQPPKEKGVEKQPEKRRNIQKKRGRETSFFLISNARKLKSGSRIMISTLALNPRNPNEPGPYTYKTPHHEIKYNAYPKTKTPMELPYKFHNRSSVPQSARFKVNKRESCDPAPGRYEASFPSVCGCRPKRFFTPEPQIFGNYEKVGDARRKWYQRMRKKLCSKNIQHIPGNGHTWLFRGGEKTKSTRKFKVKEKAIQYMSLDYRYILMINDPTRNIISHWKRIPYKQPTLRFNAILRRAARKRLKINKKIAFLSGRERFNELETRRPKSPRKEKRRSLPEHLRLCDKPITNTPIEDIQPRVYDVFEKHKGFPKLANIKRSFKFPYLPGLKMLLSDNDAHPDRDQLPGYYFKNYTLEDYFKFEFKFGKEKTKTVDDDRSDVAGESAAEEGTE